MTADIVVEEVYDDKPIYSIKLYRGHDISRCHAVLFTGLSEREADEKYQRINLALGHKRDDEGELIVQSGQLPYVLIDF